MRRLVILGCAAAAIVAASGTAGAAERRPVPVLPLMDVSGAPIEGSGRTEGSADGGAGWRMPGGRQFR